MWRRNETPSHRAQGEKPASTIHSSSRRRLNVHRFHFSASFSCSEIIHNQPIWLCHQIRINSRITEMSRIIRIEHRCGGNMRNCSQKRNSRHFWKVGARMNCQWSSSGDGSLYDDLQRKLSRNIVFSVSLQIKIQFLWFNSFSPFTRFYFKSNQEKLLGNSVTVKLFWKSLL